MLVNLVNEITGLKFAVFNVKKHKDVIGKNVPVGTIPN